MATRNISRHRRNGETSGNRVTFCHITAGARDEQHKVYEKNSGKTKNTQRRPLDLFTAAVTSAFSFSRKHVAIGKCFMAAHPHNVWLVRR